MVEKKGKFGTQLRAPVKAHLDTVVDELGNERGMVQLVVEAALMDFFELPREKKLESIRRVRDASFSGGTQGVIQGIKTKLAKQPHVTRAPSDS